MLNKDYANAILNANRLGLSLDFSPVPNKWEKLPQVVSQGISDWDKVQKTNAYVNALQSGNQDEINQAWSAYDPQGFANYQQDQAKRAEERQWHLDDLAAQRDFQREQQDRTLANQLRMFNMKQAMGGESTNAQQNVAAMIEAGYTPQEAWAMYYGGNNPTLDMATLGQKGQEAYDKKMGENAADEVMAQKQMETLTPMAQSARDRAKKALEDGTGLGQIGGLGWTTGKGGRNREDVASVKRQMNIMLRSKLKAVGVGSKELDAAREAEAYRANLDPTLPIEQQEAIIDNFFTDYVNGNLEKELRVKYGKPSLKQVNQMLTDPRVQEALDNGYSMEEIQNYLRK